MRYLREIVHHTMRYSRVNTCLAVSAALLVFAAAGCEERHDLYCAVDDPCLAGLPYCDVEGVCSESGFHGNSCIAAPCWDAGPLLDALLTDATDSPGVDAAPSGPNCSSLPATCGPAAIDSCCASELVPGGTYYRSYDAATDDHNDMSYPATLSDFRLDTYEITVGRFRAFVEAGKGTQADPPTVSNGAHAAIPQSGWEAGWAANLETDATALVAAVKCDVTYQTWTDTPGTNEHRPMNCITWYEAMAFCIWDGGYLPTEAEWNYAATGGSEQRAYPWSVPASFTAIDATFAAYEGSGATVNVGSKSPKGDGRWGHADLAGNVSEWTLDRYASPYTNPCNNCANLSALSSRVVRGGSFRQGETFLRAAYRGSTAPWGRNPESGARCARAP